MTKEEKKAIEYLKGYKYQNEVSDAIDIVLNLIQNKDTEINKLNNVIKKIEKIIDDEFAVEAVMAIGALIDDLKQVKSNS